MTGPQINLPRGDPPRVVIELPGVPPRGSKYRMKITQAAMDSGNITVHVDGKLYLTIDQNGQVKHADSGGGADPQAA